MKEQQGSGEHDHRIIHYSIAAMFSILTGAAFGLLSYAGEVNAPLSVAAGLTTCGGSFLAVAQFIGRARQ